MIIMVREGDSVYGQAKAASAAIAQANNDADNKVPGYYSRFKVSVKNIIKKCHLSGSSGDGDCQFSDEKS